MEEGMSRRGFMSSVIATGVAYAATESRGACTTKPYDGIHVHPKKNYPYSFSPVERLTQLESEIDPERKIALKIVGLLNEVADKCALLFYQRLAKLPGNLVRRGRTTIQDTLRLAARDQSFLERYIRCMGDVLHGQGLVYENHESFAYAMRTYERCKKLPLDCNMGSYAALHIARRHDMPLGLAVEYQHAYLTSGLHPEQAIESTAFTRDHRDLFQTHASKRAQQKLSDEQVTTLGYYRTLTDKELQRDMVSSVSYEELNHVWRRWDGETCRRFARKCDDWMSQLGADHYLARNGIKAHEYAAKFGDQAGHYARIRDIRKDYADILAAVEQIERDGWIVDGRDILAR